ncbi:MAG: DUF4097 family beta strand repeat-containing protein [Acidobacteriia bacterium]|nr:DUF4097 family beta strand repeat-containing protein [Terriglobia bacterium]
MNRFLMGGMIVGMIAALGALPAPAQNPVQNPLQNPAENQNSAQITVAFSNPSQPRRLVVKTLMHKVTIKGYDGKDAIIESSAISERRRRERNIPPGMHPLNVGRGGIEVTEANNVVTVSAETPLGGGDIQIQVPVETSVTVNTINNGVSVENISGEIEVESVNGGVSVTNSSGSVVATSMNGKVTVVLDKVAPGKAMSFSSMNGTIDVTLPADIKANLKMKVDNGDVYTDFDVKVTNEAFDTTESKTGKGVRIRGNRTTYGTINGGGPEMQFTTFNGRILIHKK